MIEKRDYYNTGEVETIKMIEIISRDYSGYMGFLVGQIIKYLARANYKGQFRSDLKKSHYYMTRLIIELGADDDVNE